MRLFVAIVPPPVAIAELAAAVDPLRTAAPQLRWTGSDEWHITLAFLGEVAERILPELTARLERAAARHPVQHLAIHGAGAFPTTDRARVVWAGLSADRRSLASLAASVAAGARRAGAPPPDEGRKYHPHVTLARCRDSADVSQLTRLLADFSGGRWTAAAISLIRSNLGSQPRYLELARCPLKPPPG